MRDSVQMNARSAKGIKNFAIKRMPNYVHAVNSSESLDTLKTRGTERELNSVIVLSKKDKPSPVIKGMSAKYMNRIEIGQANVETDSTLIEAISSEEGLEAPAIVVVKHNGEDSIVFDGDLKDADAIAKFIDKMNETKTVNKYFMNFIYPPFLFYTFHYVLKKLSIKK